MAYSRAAALAALVLLSCACEHQGTQALVFVTLDPALTPQVTRLEAASLDMAGKPLHRVRSFDMSGAGAAEPALSFGAVADSNDVLRLHLRALGADGALVLEQELVATLLEGKKVELTVVLQAACVNLHCPAGVPCSLSTTVGYAPSCEPTTQGTASCVSGDGICVAPCAWPEDQDCPRYNGAPCGGALDESCKSEHCVDGVCCQDSCVRHCAACNLPGSLGICTDYVPPPDAQNCGGCDLACSADNVAEPHCTLSSCDGTCAPHFDDCNHDKRTDGCEVDLRTRADHCKRCGNACPYNTCIDGECVANPVGHSTGTGEVGLLANRMYGVSVFNAASATLVGLGVRLKSGSKYVPVHVLLGIYTDDGHDHPVQLKRSTTPLSNDPNEWGGEEVISTDAGGIEQRVEHYALEKLTYYWLFIIADEMAYIATESQVSQPWMQSTNQLPYVSLHGMMPQQPDPLTSIGPSPIGDLYMITIPPPP